MQIKKLTAVILSKIENKIMYFTERLSLVHLRRKGLSLYFLNKKQAFYRLCGTLRNICMSSKNILWHCWCHWLPVVDTI